MEGETRTTRMSGEARTSSDETSELSNPVIEGRRNSNGGGSIHRTHYIPLESSPLVTEAGLSLPEANEKELAEARVRRVHRGLHLKSENVRLNELFAEGEAVKSDILHYSNVVHKLKTRSFEADAIWRDSLKFFIESQKRYSEVHDALAEAELKWKRESSELFRFRERLKVLQLKKPQLDQALMKTTEECDMLSQNLAAAIIERDKLQVLLKSLSDTNREAQTVIKKKSANTQTACDLQFISEIDKIKGDLNNQMKTVKRVREAIDLVRRCS